ncbi:MAG: bifunctional riboflavin kinase/FAD synthetase [Xanthobacteraceae bacterium]
MPLVVVRDAVEASARGRDKLKGAVLALGNFEGVHRGHRAVFAAARRRAQDLHCPAAAMTFEPHPRAFFNPGAGVFRLTDLTAKLRLLATTGLAGTIVMDFNAALAALTAEEFIARILVERYAAAGVVVGDDFHFGKGRGGTPAFLEAQGRERGFAVDIVQAFLEGSQRVSSGAVRDALAQGEVEQAARLLGYPWFVTGTVVHGDKRGRELGFPTANIKVDPNCRLRHGVYAVRVGIGGARYDGVANFGRRPMFDTGVVLLEVFLFDFAGDLYGQTLDVAFIGWVRPEEKFASIAELIAQMQEDSRVARAALARAQGAFPVLAAADSVAPVSAAI